MKNRKNSIAIVAMCLFCMGVIVNCTHKDQDLTPPTPPTGPSDKELVSIITTTPPTIDGTIDASWDSVPKLVTKVQVPNPGNALFVGYIGEQYPITLRSMYDATSIYFLAEIEDATKNVQVAPWYFNPTTKRWAQEPTARTFDANGKLSREGWGEDKLAFLWNIDNSTLKFTEQTCYASCHLFTPYINPTTTPPTAVANNSGNHYTNGANEKIDMWWLKVGRDPIHNQFSDEYQDWAGGPSFGNLVGGNLNGRHQDDQVPNGTFSTTWPYKPNYSSNVSTTGTSNNTQSLPLTANGTTTNVSVPKYIIPGRSNYYYILRTEVTSGTAKLVTAVDSMGVLTLDDATTIDPNIGTDFQRIGDPVTGGDGPKIIPSYVSEGPLTNGRADISGCQAVHTGSKWIIEWKRALKTPDVLKQDVDFSSLDDQPFGVAYFDKSNYQHGIKPNLTLKFKK